MLREDLAQVARQELVAAHPLVNIGRYAATRGLDWA